MSASLSMDNLTYSLGNPVERLERALNENKGRYTVTKNGSISLDLSNEKVQEAIEKQIKNLSGIKGSR